MATFELTDTDGSIYDLEAPDHMAAFSAFKKMKGMGGYDTVLKSQSGGAKPGNIGIDAAPQYDAMGNFMGGVSPDAQRDARQPGQPVGYGEDIVKSIGTGLTKGVTGLAGLPATAANIAETVGLWANRKVSGEPYEQQQARIGKLKAENTNPSLLRRGMDNLNGDALTKSLEANVTGPLHKPQTLPGKYAETIAEFIPGAVATGPGGVVRGAGNALRNAVTFGAVPGVASEAAGQATAGSWAEPWARAFGAVAGGVGASLAQRPSSAGNAIARSMQEIPAAQRGQMVDAGEAIFQEAQRAGLNISRANAIDAASNGATSLGDIQRFIEGTGRMKGFYANEGQSVQRAAGQMLDEIAPPVTSRTGPALQETAEAALNQTPEGQAYGAALWQAGPRVTPAQAGEVIQPELARTFQGREGMRTALADVDYAAARNAPANIPLDGGFGFRDVTKHFDPPPAPSRPVYPTPTEADLAAQRRAPPGFSLSPAEEAAAARARQGAAPQPPNPADLTATERMPILGLEPTKFAQADVSTVLRHLDSQLESAKGATAQGLAAARKALMTPAGELDTTIAGLDSSRKAITDLISEAKTRGLNNTVRELEGSLGTLDQALEAVPAYGQARRGFRAASEPLAPFEQGRAPGQIIERDQFNQRFVMPPERAPGAIDQGPSAARDFRFVASPEARQAYEGHLTTRMLDSAADGAGNLNANTLRQSIRANEDQLAQFPAVRDRLSDIADSRAALDRLKETTYLGKIASKPEVRNAMEALYPAKPEAGGAAEVMETVSALAKVNPTIARNLVRAHLETEFNASMKRFSRANGQMTGVGFAQMVKANPESAARIAASIRALPGGEQVLTGVDRFFALMDAMGYRQAVGSRTTFNAQIREDLRKAGLSGDAIKIAGSAGIKWPAKLTDAIDNWRFGRNVDELSALFTDPTAGPVFKSLATAEVGSSHFFGLAGRLVALGLHGARGKSEPVRNDPPPLTIYGGRR